MAFSLSVIDESRVGDVQDVVIQVQERWFMETALHHNVWFPPSSFLRGLRSTKYVAYYQSADNETPHHLTHVARLRKVWNAISFDEALSLPEFKSFFSDDSIRSKVATFKNKEGLFHIALTDVPVKFSRPIPLGNPRTALVLTAKRFPLSRLIAANTTDDLFGAADE